MASFAGWLAPEIPRRSLLRAQLLSRPPHPASTYVGANDPCLSPPACSASALSTESSPQPPPPSDFLSSRSSCSCFMCAHLWVNGWVRVRVEARHQRQFSSSVASVLFFKIELLTESGTHPLARVSGQQAPGILLAPHPQSWESKSPISPSAAFYRGFRRCKFGFLCSWGKHFTNSVTSKAPQLLFYRELQCSFSRPFIFVSVLLRLGLLCHEHHFEGKCCLSHFFWLRCK